MQLTTFQFRNVKYHRFISQENMEQFHQRYGKHVRICQMSTAQKIFFWHQRRVICFLRNLLYNYCNMSTQYFVFDYEQEIVDTDLIRAMMYEYLGGSNFKNGIEDVEVQVLPGHSNLRLCVILPEPLAAYRPSHEALTVLGIGSGLAYHDLNSLEEP